MPKNEAGFLAEVEELLNEKMGYPAGTLKLLEICQRHAGTEVYIPSKTEASMAYRDSRIREKYNGCNLSELMIEFDLSENQIRTIIKNGIGHR